MKRLNWNDTVKVKLTDLGKDIYYHQYDELNALHPNLKKVLEPKFPEVDDEGFTEFLLWKFMQLYGKHIGMGFPAVVQDVNFYIDESIIQDIK